MYTVWVHLKSTDLVFPFSGKARENEKSLGVFVVKAGFLAGGMVLLWRKKSSAFLNCINIAAKIVRPPQIFFSSANNKKVLSREPEI